MTNKVSVYEEEFFLSAKRRALLAYVVAGICLTIALVSVGAVLMLTPLKETKPYVFLVDETTGTTQRGVEISPMQISEENAVIQANVVRYVIDRETYDTFDNTSRIRSVLDLSESHASEGLKQLWGNVETNAQHPDTVYGPTVRVLVKVTGVTMLDDNIAQVFIYRTREQKGFEAVENRSLVTVGFQFDPTRVNTVEELWDNPLGFVVTDYRLDGQATGN